MSVSVVVILSNLMFWLLWMVIEIRRRRQGHMPEVPLSLVLIIIALNTLLFDQMLMFRLGAFVSLCLAVYEARLFIQRGAPELTLAGAIISGGFGAAVLTWWAVININEHLILAMG